jgi:hypothetical protein
LPRIFNWTNSRVEGNGFVSGTREPRQSFELTIETKVTIWAVRDLDYTAGKLIQPISRTP